MTRRPDLSWCLAGIVFTDGPRSRARSTLSGVRLCYGLPWHIIPFVANLFGRWMVDWEGIIAQCATGPHVSAPSHSARTLRFVLLPAVIRLLLPLLQWYFNFIQDDCRARFNPDHRTQTQTSGFLFLLVQCKTGAYVHWYLESICQTSFHQEIGPYFIRLAAVARPSFTSRRQLTVKYLASECSWRGMCNTIQDFVALSYIPENTVS